jgi:hypothetical protein
VSLPSPLRAALVTLSVPLPEPVRPDALDEALRRPRPGRRVLVEAFLTKIPVEILHDVVLAGCWSFAEPAAAAAFYGIDDPERRRWFEEMAGSDELATAA